MRKWILAAAMAMSASGAQAMVCPSGPKPICALTAKGERANFPDICAAKREGARVLHADECAAPGKEPMMCNMLYQPVCATDPATGAEKTYPNLCQSEVKNAAVLHDGECAAPQKSP